MILAAGLTLSACATPAPAPVFRDAAAPIWSAAAFQPARVVGPWRQAADFAAGPGACRSGSLTIAPDPAGLRLQGTLCLNGQEVRLDAPARATGPGRLAVAGQGEWWVLWVDSGYRTLAIGTPTGRFGFVLDRGSLPPDRLAAAAEVFAFNGYPPRALRPFPD